MTDTFAEAPGVEGIIFLKDKNESLDIEVWMGAAAKGWPY